MPLPLLPLLEQEAKRVREERKSGWLSDGAHACLTVCPLAAVAVAAARLLPGCCRSAEEACSCISIVRIALSRHTSQEGRSWLNEKALWWCVIAACIVAFLFLSLSLCFFSRTNLDSAFQQLQHSGKLQVDTPTAEQRQNAAAQDDVSFMSASDERQPAVSSPLAPPHFFLLLHAHPACECDSERVQSR